VRAKERKVPEGGDRAKSEKKKKEGWGRDTGAPFGRGGVLAGRGREKGGCRAKEKRRESAILKVGCVRNLGGEGAQRFRGGGSPVGGGGGQTRR